MEIPNFLWNVGGVLVGAGISWGWLKNEVVNLREDLRVEKQTNKEQEEKITKLKDRGLDLVFRADCGSLRGECQERICLQFEAVKNEIRENREASAAMNKEISTFMGYVKATLEELRRK